MHCTVTLIISPEQLLFLLVARSIMMTLFDTIKISISIEFRGIILLQSYGYI